MMRAQLPCSLAGAVFIAASITLMAKQAAKYNGLLFSRSFPSESNGPTIG